MTTGEMPLIAVCSLGSNKCHLYFCDNKVKVPIGEPGTALLTRVCGTRCLAPPAKMCAAADHNIPQTGSLTPPDLTLQALKTTS